VTVTADFLESKRSTVCCELYKRSNFCFCVWVATTDAKCACAVMKSATCSGHVVLLLKRKISGYVKATWMCDLVQSCVMYVRYECKASTKPNTSKSFCKHLINRESAWVHVQKLQVLQSSVSILRQTHLVALVTDKLTKNDLNF
jgi:hypothetical protein